MSVDDEREREANRTRRELLKEKQGLTDESSEPMIPVYEKPTGWAVVKNFFFYYKGVVITLAVITAVTAYLIIQTFTRVKPDVRVMLVAADYSSGISECEESAYSVFNELCPDINGDGKVNAEIISVDLAADESTGEYYIAETTKFSNEIKRSTRLIITDEAFVQYASDDNGFQTDRFVDLSEDFPNTELFMERGIRVKDTKLSGKGIPENAVIFLLTDNENAPNENDALYELVRSLRR